MKPRLVFVHGIGGPRRSDNELRLWADALAKGAVAAGHSVAAAAFAADPEAVAFYAYYGDLLGRPGAQGAMGDLSEQDARLVIEMLRELVEQQLAVAVDERSERILTTVREQVRPAGDPQGTGDMARMAINGATTLMGWGPLRRAGQWASGRLLVGDLAQVARYLNRGEFDGQSTLDQRIRDRVRGFLGDGPAVVVAHSLGTVVAFETLHEFGGEVPLFVTLGSPIAMRTVVWPRLRPQPPATPEPVRRWLNFWDRDDVIASRPGIEAGIVPNGRAVIPVTSRVDSDGIWVHTATKYLAQPAVAGPVMEALTTTRSGA